MNDNGTISNVLRTMTNQIKVVSICAFSSWKHRWTIKYAYPDIVIIIWQKCAYSLHRTTDHWIWSFLLTTPRMPKRVKAMLTFVTVLRFLTGRTAASLNTLWLKATMRELEVGSEQFNVTPDCRNRAEKPDKICRLLMPCSS